MVSESATKMHGGELTACDVDRSRFFLHSSFVPHIRTIDALGPGMRSIVRRESQELSYYRYDEDLHPATTPAFLASIPEANDFIAADRARRRPRRIGHLTRAEFPGSTGELRSRYWSAHPSPTCEYPTSPPHRPRQNSSQGQFELKSSFSYFDGDSYAEDYLDWENEVDEFFYYTYIPQERQVKYVICKLTGQASDWWMYLTQARRCEGRSEVRTWRKMKRLLREQFLSSEILGELYSKEKLASEEEFRMKEEDGDEGSVGNLSRSRSVPTSAPTYGSIGLNAEDSDSRTHDKSVVMEGTAKCRSGKTSFKERESSLLYLKSKKSCRDEFVSSLREINENGPQILSAEVVDDMHDDSSPAIQTPIPVASLSRSFVTEMGRISFPVDLNNNSDEIKISPKANLPHQEPELDILRDQLKSFLNQRLLGMRSEESSSLQNQVQAVAPIVLQQYAPDVIEVLLSEASLAISLLTNRRTRDMIMILNSKRFLDRLVSTLVEKKQHELKLRDSLKDLGVRRRELQKSLASSWPKQVYERINAPLLTLVSFGGPEQSYAVLSHLLLLVMRAPFLFSLDYKHFYCQYSEPSYVQKLKLEMLTAIANESNTYEIFTELCENVTNVDISISRESIRAVGKIALRQYDVNAIVDRLLQFLEMEKDYVSAETLVLVKDLLRKSPQWSHDCIAVVGNISLLNGFVGNALGSCLDYSPPSVPLHGNFDVGDLTFNLEESFTGVQPSYESYAVELRSWAQSEHKIFNEEIVVKAFFEDQLQHLQNFPPKPGWCASFSTPDF